LKRAQIPENFVIAYENEKLTRAKLKEEQFVLKENKMKNSVSSSEIPSLTFCGDGKIYFDETKKLKSESESGKSLEMKMSDDGESFEMFSPIWLKTVVEAAADGPVIEVRKMRNGTVLIETSDKEQASKIIKLVNIAGIYSVTVSEISMPQRTKGVIWCPDLRYSNDQEVLDSLKPAGVVSIQRLQKRETKKVPAFKPTLRKIAENLNGLSSKTVILFAPIEDSRDTGIYFLTFNCELPTELLIGFTKVKVKPFVNNPMRCYKCLKFGHTQTRCKNNVEVCCNCGQTKHTDQRKSERCEKKPKCVNCEADHNSFSKSCPIYKKEAEIQVIMKKFRCTYTAAKRRWDFESQSSLQESAQQVETAQGTGKHREVTAMAHGEVTAKAPKTKPFKVSVKKPETGKKRKKADLRGSSSGESSNEDKEPYAGTSKQSKQDDETDTEDDTKSRESIEDFEEMFNEVEILMTVDLNEATKRIKELLLTANKEEKKYLKDNLKEAYKQIREKARNEIPKISLSAQNK
jgi:hypothetical protein